MRIDHLPRSLGVYKITHVPSGRSYAGGSVNVHRRVNDHRTRLRSGRGQSPFLQSVWSSTDEIDWIAVFLEGVTEDQAIKDIPEDLRLNVIVGEIGGKGSWSPSVRDSMLQYRESIGFVMPLSPPPMLTSHPGGVTGYQSMSPEEREEYRVVRRRSARLRRRLARQSV